MEGKILELDIHIESSGLISDYTGKLSKTIILSEVPIEYAFKPMKGFYKPLRVSPPIQGDKALVPTYVLKSSEKTGEKVWDLKPVMLAGDYRIEVGSTPDLIDKLYDTLKNSIGLITRIKFDNTFVKYVIKDLKIVEPNIRVSSGVIIKTTSPALLPNPFVASQHVRRFTISPSVMLWIPSALANKIFTHNTHEIYKILIRLESCLTEHYATWQKTVFINYDNKREPALMAKTKYLLTENNCREEIEKTLRNARIFGIGASRASGFGSIEAKGL